MNRFFFALLISTFAVGLFASASDQLDLGRRMQADKLYDEAIQQFSAVVTSAPASDEAEEALLRSGDIERTRGRFADGEAYYLRLWEGYPRSIRRGQALAGLAECRYRQGKYAAASDDFAKLFQQYPMIDETRKAVAMYVDTVFRQGDYQEAVVRGNEALKSYPDATTLPDVLALMARAYEQLNSPDQADILIARLTKDYPSTNARWEMVGMQAERTARKQGPDAAARQLRAALSASTPRDVEESLREQTARWFIAAGNDQEAADELSLMTKKFTASDRLDRYVFLLTDAQLRLHRYQDIIQAADSTLFSNSSLRLAQMYRIGCAKAGLSNWKGAWSDASAVLRQAKTDSLRFAATVLLAQADQGLGRYRDAIRLNQEIIRSYPTLADIPELYRQIGDLWADNLDQPTEALRFYRQSSALSVNPDPRTILATVRSLVQLERFNEAGEELQRLAPEMITDRELRHQYDDLSQWIDLRQTQPEIGLQRALSALARYANDTDRFRLQHEIATILADDSRDYAAALAVLPQTLDNVSLRADYTLQIARLYRLENQPDSARFYREEAGRIAAGIVDSQTKAEFNVDLLQEAADPSYPTALANLVQQFPNCHDRFKLTLARARMDSHRNDEALALFRTLHNDGSITENDYLQARLELAEVDYRQGDYTAAKPLYEEARALLTVDRPAASYHRLRCLTDASVVVPQLTFLLDNADSFTERQEATLYLAGMLSAQHRPDTALEVLANVPENQRDPKFYHTQCSLYRAVGNLQKAKEALMHIVDKDLPTLNELAELQIATHDNVMAAYTYSLLLSKDPANSDRYRTILGHLAFIDDRYDDVVSLEQPLLAKPNPGAAARETVIAYYRLGNRPKAEALRKQFRDILKDDAFSAEITLAEGIYDMKALPDDAIKAFNGLLKDKTTPDNLKFQAYYWRGVVYQQQNNLPSALADFTQAATAPDNKLSCQASLKIGNLQFTQQKYNEALQAYGSVIDRDSTGTLAKDAAHNFAVVCKTLNEWDRAISAYESMLQRWGDQDIQGETLFNIAYCYYRDKKYTRAVEMFDKALPLLTDDESKAEAMYWEAESYFGEEDWENAVNAFLKVSYTYPNITQWAATAELRTADAYQKQGQADKMKYMLQRVITKYGADSMWGAQAQQTLQGMQ